MKNLFALISSLIITCSGIAQPVISNIEPAIGDTFLYTQADNTDYSLDLTGADVYWDFSGLNAQALNEINYTIREEQTAQKIFKIYPNPASDFIVLNVEIQGKVELKVFSSDGKLVMEKLLQSNEKINVNSFSSGYYVAILEIDNAQFKPISFVVY